MSRWIWWEDGIQQLGLVRELMTEKTCMAAEPAYLCRGKRIETPRIKPTYHFLNFKKWIQIGHFVLPRLRSVERLGIFCRIFTGFLVLYGYLIYNMYIKLFSIPCFKMVAYYIYCFTDGFFSLSNTSCKSFHFSALSVYLLFLHSISVYVCVLINLFTSC